jgi:protein-tyrosine phosphatase
MHPDSAVVLRGLGAEPGDFRARQLIEGFVREADLTLTMTSAHRRDVLALAPRALSRTFTLREAADLLRLVGEDLDVPGEDFADRGRRLVQEMATARSRRHSGADDDIRDPIGRPIEVHAEVGDAITDSLLPVLRRFGALRPSGSVGRAGAVGPVGPGDSSSASGNGASQDS